MRTIYKEHVIEQREALERDLIDFDREWCCWPFRLSRAGMSDTQIDRLRVQCWKRFLEGRGVSVDLSAA